MAQASSNAQREPSMEEILASIRRIIEDSDTGEGDTGSGNSQETAADVGDSSERSAEPEASSVDSDAETEVAASEPAEADFESITGDDIEAAATDEPTHVVHEDAEVRSFRAELSDDEPESSSDEASQAADTSMSALSLADIQAEVEKQVSSEEPEVVDTEKQETEAPASEDTAASDDAVESAADSTADDTSEETTDTITQVDNESETATAAEQSGEGSLAALAESIMAEDMDAMREGLTGPSDATSEQETARDMSPGTHAPIISERAGRQVAAAFDELSDAFSQTRQKSFDEMAEDMMRPMLQDWLDNNLPVLVERLVREEIDRVARGASRS